MTTQQQRNRRIRARAIVQRRVTFWQNRQTEGHETYVISHDKNRGPRNVAECLAQAENELGALS